MWPSPAPPTKNTDGLVSLLAELQQFQEGLGGKAHGKVCYGWRQKSVGQAVVLPDSSQIWSQVAQHRSSEVAVLFQKRLASKDQIEGIQAPRLLTIQSQDEPCRTFWTSTFVESKPLSTTPELQTPFHLENAWLTKLEMQLLHLAEFPAPFQSCRQELITRRIQERYGSDLPITIEVWKTIHGDLHWANVAEDCTLFDWEGWGIGPRYLDLAFLYGYSVAIPSMCVALQEKCPILFTTSDGLVCLLFVCSELLRMIELYGDHPQLQGPLENLAERVIQQLKQRP